VDLGGCGMLTRADVCMFLARHPAAHDFVGLGLSGTEGLDDEAMRIIGGRFRRLRRLSAGYYAGEEAALLAALSANQATLVALELHWPRALSDDLAMALTVDGAFKELRVLNVQGVKGMSIDGLCAIVNMHQRRAGVAAMPAFDAVEWLHWCTTVGDAAGARAGGAGAGAGAGAAMDVDGAEVSLTDKLGPGIAMVTARFSGAESAGAVGLKQHCQVSNYFVKVD
jgi:hypothetical protein